MQIQQRSGSINGFCIGFVDKNRPSLLKNFPDFEAFDKGFPLDESLFSALRAEAEDRKIGFRPEDFERSKADMGQLIKALISRDLYGDESFYRVVNRKDPAIKKALEVLGTKGSYERYLGGS